MSAALCDCLMSGEFRFALSGWLWFDAVVDIGTRFGCGVCLGSVTFPIELTAGLEAGKHKCHKASQSFRDLKTPSPAGEGEQFLLARQQPWSTQRAGQGLIH